MPANSETASPTTGAAARAAGPMWVYIGTYTGAKSKGIYRMRFDPATGALSAKELAAETPSPSFLAVSPSHRFLYAVNEIGDYEGKSAGSITAFALDAKTGTLTALNTRSTGGSSPCHLVLDKQGRHALVANYGGGSVAVFPIGADGKLGEASCFIQHHGTSVNPQRQEGPHAHVVELDAAGTTAYVADLGLDQVVVYGFDSHRGTLTPKTPGHTAPGAGPRHTALSRDGAALYVINELNSTVTAFHRDKASGELTEFQAITTLPEDFKGTNYPAELQISADGRFLYGSNRGHDSIAVFAVDPDSKRLTTVQIVSTGGKNPRNFSLDPSGDYLLAANVDTDSIVVFRVDRQTGKLTPAGVTAEAPMPVCVTFVPIGH